MSWYCGSQLTQIVASSDANALVMTWRLCARLERPIMTPLGVEVEPDVYWRKAKDGGGLTGGSGALEIVSVASHRTPSVSSLSKVRPLKYEDVVSTIDAPDALTIDSKCLAVRASLFLGSGG